MPRRKFTRKRKDQSDELADLLAKQRQIRDTFEQRKGEMSAAMQAEYDEITQSIADNLGLPVADVRKAIAERRDLTKL